MNKLYVNAESVLAGLVRDGLTLAPGGFGLCYMFGMLREHA